MKFTSFVSISSLRKWNNECNTQFCMIIWKCAHGKWSAFREHTTTWAKCWQETAVRCRWLHRGYKSVWPVLTTVPLHGTSAGQGHAMVLTASPSDILWCKDFCVSHSRALLHWLHWGEVDISQPKRRLNTHSPLQTLAHKGRKLQTYFSSCQHDEVLHRFWDNLSK